MIAKGGILFIKSFRIKSEVYIIDDWIACMNEICKNIPCGEYITNSGWYVYRQSTYSFLIFDIMVDFNLIDIILINTHVDEENDEINDLYDRIQLIIDSYIKTQNEKNNDIVCRRIL